MATQIQLSGEKFKARKRALAKRNKAFDLLTVKQQRVWIAKDVLELLKAEKINAYGMYFALDDADENAYDKACTKPGIFGNAQVKTKVVSVEAALVLDQVHCNVCGIGSLFVATVRNHNDFSIGRFHNLTRGISTRSTQVNYLSKWFSWSQLNLVETYFEFSSRFGTPESTSPIRKKKSLTQRLIAIMENIISNNGEFNPYKGRHAVR